MRGAAQSGDAAFFSNRESACIFARLFEEILFNICLNRALASKGPRGFRTVGPVVCPSSWNGGLEFLIDIHIFLKPSIVIRIVQEMSYVIMRTALEDSLDLDNIGTTKTDTRMLLVPRLLATL